MTICVMPLPSRSAQPTILDLNVRGSRGLPAGSFHHERNCRENKQVCPLPKAWQQLWEMLPEKRRTVDAWGAAIPLIGAAWHDASVMLKMVRLAEHLRWAAFSAPRLRN